MKKFFSLATAFMFTLGAFAQPAQPKAEDLIKVNVEKHDFGKIVQGTPVVYTFEIKNISDKPVVVENTWASCGCTTPEKITEPIQPGKTAPLKVQYNAAAAAAFTKDVYIKLSGVDQPKSVQIVGEVLTAEAYDVYKKDGGKPASDGATTVKTTETPSAKPAVTKEASKTTSSKTTTSSKPKLTKD